jgi:hypothetical protein
MGQEDYRPGKISYNKDKTNKIYFQHFHIRYDLISYLIMH